MVVNDIFYEYIFIENNVQDEGGCQLQEESRDNRAIIDNNQAQSLTGEDIDAMRRS